jgi:hypothetical protein
MLPMITNNYMNCQHSADGAAIKIIDFASNLGIARILRKTDDTPDTSSVPSLRSGGLSVVRINKAEQTHESLIRQDTLNQNLGSSTDTTLDAEDITRGFAIDVWDSLTGPHVLSLCQRMVL